MKRIFVFLIKIYQKLISPLKPPCCRYYPSCSQYAVIAFKKHGILKGFYLSASRLLRCNPWSKGGVDFVPEKYYFTRKNQKKFGGQ